MRVAFCVQCGQSHANTATFCNQCGRRVAGEAAPPQATEDHAAPPQATEGHAALVLSASRRLGIFKSVHCYLVFREREVLLAHLGKENQKLAIEQFRREQKEQGKGLLATTLAMANFWRNYGQRYYASGRQEILAQDPQNMAIEYSSISKMLFNVVRDTDNGDSTTSTKGGSLEIRTPATKFKFGHGYYDHNKKIKEILSQLVGQSLKYKAPMITWNLTIGGDKDAIS